MSIIRGTTDDLVFDFEGVNMDDVAVVWLTFKQFCHEVVTKEIADFTIEDNRVYVHLTQEDTLAMKANRHIRVQARLYDKDGNALATVKYTDKVEDVLKDGVIGAGNNDEDPADTDEGENNGV